MSDNEEKQNAFKGLLHKKRKLLELRELVMSKSKSPRNLLVDEKDTCSSEMLFSNEPPSISPPPFSPLTPLIQELRHKNSTPGESNFDVRSDTSEGLRSSPLLKDLENEDHTSSPIRPMSPETRELYDLLNEPDLEFENIDLMQSPDLMANKTNAVQDNSETDCESCDDILSPKDLQKNTSNTDKIDNNLVESAVSVENEKIRAENQETITNISNDNTQNIATAATSFADINSVTEARNEDPTKENSKVKKKGRSRKEREESKRLRNSGKGYVTEKGKKVGERKLSSLRTCRLKCSERFSELERKQSFDEYWALGSRDRRAMYYRQNLSMLS